jgi:hypothetical protein
VADQAATRRSARLIRKASGLVLWHARLFSLRAIVFGRRVPGLAISRREISPPIPITRRTGLTPLFITTVKV